ncbi:MAG: calcium/sodium antiporter [Gammaproteobacteria bacterium]|nr:calcium/sodium antiporter [Gammaproteobacteria bacterium]
MLNYSLAVIGGFLFLVWGADRFVIGAAATARNLGVAPLIIGLTIVGFGTSAPEMLVSTVAALQGNPGLAVGNAIGSNITNIALILGLTAVIMPLAINSKLLRRELPILTAAMVAGLFLLLDGELSRLDGMFLLLGLLAMVIWMVRTGMAERNGDPLEAEFSDEIPSDMPMLKALFWVGIGLLVLLASSQLLVWGAVGIAKTLGVSDLIIGLTIVALGTSLPELAASIVSALKGEHDIAVGNVIGSNLFNLLAVLGIPGLLHPLAIEAEVLSRDYPIMIGLTLIFFVMAFGFRGRGRINRIEGGLLLACYLGYQTLLYFSIVATTA